MFDEFREFEQDDFDAFTELDGGELEEWDSLKDLLSDLDERERERVPSTPGAFEVPALLGDGDGIARWVLRLGTVRRLSAVNNLRQGLPRAHWCIAVRVIAIDSDGIRLGVTTTRRVTQEQLSEFVARLSKNRNDLNVEIEPLTRQSVGV